MDNPKSPQVRAGVKILNCQLDYVGGSSPYLLMGKKTGQILGYGTDLEE